MARLLGPAASCLVVLFWLLMNGLLVLREIEYRGLDEYRRGVVDFLGDGVRRERWMGVYRDRKRIGHTGFAIERLLGEETLGYRLEFSTRLEVDLFGEGGLLSLEGEAELDGRLVPIRLHARIGAGPAELRVRGRREGGEFLLIHERSEGELILFRSPLAQLHFGDGLAPLPPVAGLEVGETRRVPVFDPIFRDRTEAHIRVLAAVVKEADGVPVDCLELETLYRGNRFRSWVTRDGEILRQELPHPLNVVLVRERERPRPVRE